MAASSARSWRTPIATRIEARGLTLHDVVNALNQSNLILPAGDAKIGSTDYFIYSNSMVPEVNELNSVPVKVGKGQVPVLMEDVAAVKMRRRYSITRF